MFIKNLFNENLIYLKIMKKDKNKYILINEKTNIFKTKEIKITKIIRL